MIINNKEIKNLFHRSARGAVRPFQQYIHALRNPSSFAFGRSANTPYAQCSSWFSLRNARPDPGALQSNTVMNKLGIIVLGSVIHFAARLAEKQRRTIITSVPPPPPVSNVQRVHPYPGHRKSTLHQINNL